MISRLLVGFLFLLFVARVSWAQEGPYLGYQLGYQSYQGDLTGSALMVGLRGGYFTSRPVSFELRAQGGSKTYQFGGAVEYAFVRKKTFRSYVQAGWGWYAIWVGTSSDEALRLRGNGPDIGIGFDYFTNPRSSVGLSVLQRFIRYDQSNDPRLRRDLDSQNTVINLRWNIYY